MDDYDPIPNLETEAGYNELMTFLNESHDFRKAARHSLQQGMYSGGGAVVGGLILGPVGGLLGGIVGSIVGWQNSENYNGVLAQLRSLPPSHQRQLLKQVATIAQQGTGAVVTAINSPSALRTALVAAAANREVRDRVWRACVDAMND